MALAKYMYGALKQKDKFDRSFKCGGKWYDYEQIADLSNASGFTKRELEEQWNWNDSYNERDYE